MKQKIIILPNLLISQIAAGEVIERPSSIIKELIENSLDAGSTHIDIKLEQGGMDSIIISDNGNGIDKYDLPFALMRHATSKINTLADLENISTLGFRGEALAAISSIAHVCIQSRTKNSQYGFKINAHDLEQIILQNNISDIDLQNLDKILTPYNMEIGTTVSIIDIFYRTPARKKFLKTPQTEWGHCLDIIRKLALLNPNVTFEITHNSKKTHVFKACSIYERVNNFLGKEFCDSVIVVDKQIGEYKLLAFLGAPLLANERSNNQFSIINNRFVKDKIVAHAMKFCYKDILHGNKQPIYLIYLQVPNNEIDVNVHPAKAEVRFKNTQAIHQFIYNTIEPELSKSLQNNRIDQENLIPVSMSNSSDNSVNLNINKDNKNLEQIESIKNLRQEILNFKEQNNLFENIKMINTENLNNLEAQISNIKDIDTLNQPRKTFTYETINQDYYIPDNNLDVPPLGFAIAQLHGVYILSQSRNGLIIVDMHAAHERVIYEQLKNQLNTNHVLTQNLMIPYIVYLDEVSLIKIINYLDILEKLGFQAKIINDVELHIYSLPQLLDKSRIKDLINNVITDLLQDTQIDLTLEQKNKILSTMACHRALRANDKLSIAEMNILLRQIESTDKGQFCNHGRPTYQEISIIELDKMFMRGK